MSVETYNSHELPETSPQIDEIPLEIIAAIAQAKADEQYFLQCAKYGFHEEILPHSSRNPLVFRGLKQQFKKLSAWLSRFFIHRQLGVTKL